MQSTDWAREHSDALREYFGHGMSFSEIAEAINARFNTAYSRSAVLGRAKRIGLARALYGDPFLVVLDEPNASLDSEGDEALTRAILGVRARGGIVVVIAHRPSALAGVDTLLVMQAGRMAAFGPKETVLKQALRPAPMPTPAPVRFAEGARA